MDSLLANYASSDEEHEEQKVKPPSPINKLNSKAEGEDFLSKSDSKPAGIFSTLPPPKSSLFNSLPPPKSQSFANPKAKPNFEQKDVQIDDRFAEKSKPKVSSSSMFASIPGPKSSLLSSSTSKRVVQFRPPTMPNPYSKRVNDEDEDEDEVEKERQNKRSKESVSTSSPASFLSTIPAPRHTATLGAFPSALGAVRRSMIETTGAPTSVDSVNESETVVSSNVGSFKDQSSEMNSESELYGNYSAYGADRGENVALGAVNSAGENDASVSVGSSEVMYDESIFYYSGRNLGNEDYFDDNSSGKCVNVGPESVAYSYEDHANYVASYGDYSGYTHYENNSPAASTEPAIPEVSGVVENPLQVPGMKGRKDAPQQILEVKQDELMKNRPREDQTKMTGIAFGPAYQPTSTKGKPTKLHKRKHQIGSLYFDMKQKEMELAERRSKGYLTKSQTQAKYGW